MTARLVKIDRNGSKHYEGMIECPKCYGRGLIVHHMENGRPSYQWTDNGVCWKCGGSGKVLGKWIERTPEYEAKLEAKRRAKQEAKEAELQKKMDEIRIEWLKRNGFTEDGFTFLFLGDTYSMKDEIKALGGRYDACGWHIDHEVEGFQFLKVSKDEILMDSHWGFSFDSNLNYRKMREDAFKTLNKVPESNHIGQVGQRLTVKVKYIHTASWENNFGYGYWTSNVTNLHKFVDENGNILVWKTSNFIEEDYGTEMMLTGTVKEHSEYKDDKQTVMTRCKLTEV